MQAMVPGYLEASMDSFRRNQQQFKSAVEGAFANSPFAEMAKRNEPLKPLPEFGSPEDFPLVQALNQLKGQPVIASKSAVERKAEAKPDAKP